MMILLKILQTERMNEIMGIAKELGNSAKNSARSSTTKGHPHVASNSLRSKKQNQYHSQSNQK